MPQPTTPAATDIAEPATPTTADLAWDRTLELAQQGAYMLDPEDGYNSASSDAVGELVDRARLMRPELAKRTDELQRARKISARMHVELAQAKADLRAAMLVTPDVYGHLAVVLSNMDLRAVDRRK